MMQLIILIGNVQTFLITSESPLPCLIHYSFASFQSGAWRTTWRLLQLRCQSFWDCALKDTSAGISSVGPLLHRMEVLQFFFSNTISWSMVYSLRTFLSLFSQILFRWLVPKSTLWSSSQFFGYTGKEVLVQSLFSFQILLMLDMTNL